MQIPDLLEKADHLISLANDTIKSRYDTDFQTFVDSGKIAGLRSASLSFIGRVYGDTHSYFKEFDDRVSGRYFSSAQAGLNILKSIKHEIETGQLENDTELKEPLYPLYNIFDRFHIISRQLRVRHGDRPTLSVDDEYDVQDLLHSLLKVHFDDIRPEEWTPSYAGKSSRMDFLLPEHKIVIEVKKTRKSLTGKDIGDELIIDIERYGKYPNIEHLFCFVYDPEGYVANPKGFETDLSRVRDGLEVQVYVRPKF